LFVANARIIHMKMYKKSGNPPQEDLAKYGYKPYRKYKTLICLLYLWICNQSHLGIKFDDFTNFSSLISGDWKSPKSLHFQVFIFEFHFLVKFRHWKKLQRTCVLGISIGLVSLILTEREKHIYGRDGWVVYGFNLENRRNF